MTVILQKGSQSNVREKIWKVIRGLIEFTFDEVATISEEKASTYLFHLYHAGYIRQAGKRTEANGRKKVVWRLIRNTGPRAPVPCRCLYDPNIDEAKPSDKPESLQAKKPRSGGRHVD